MKKKDIFLTTVFGLLFWLVIFVLIANAGDIYDETVYVRETRTQVIYYGTCTFGAADSADNHYTQFFQIDDCNKEHAYIWATCTDVAAATEDVNILAYYSINTDTAIVSSLNSGVVLDQVTATTMQADTLTRYGGANDTYFNGARFMRLNLDGQAANPSTAVLSWWAIFKKNDPTVGVEKQILNHKP